MILYSWLEGDCLRKVSEKFNVSIEELCNVNGITNVDSISVGDLIEIPSKGEVKV
mgnify:FL=1